MGENTRYIHIRHPKTFPRQSYRIQNPSPFPAPFSLLVSRFVIAVPLIVLPCRCGGEIAFMFKQPIVLTIMRLIVSPLSCRLPCRVSRRYSRPVHLICSSHPSISSCVRSSRPVLAVPPFRPSLSFRLSSSRSSPRCPDKQGGALSPYFRIAVPVSSVSAHPMLLDVETCRGMSQDAVSGKQTRSVSLSPFRPRR